MSFTLRVPHEPASHPVLGAPARPDHVYRTNKINSMKPGYRSWCLYQSRQSCLKDRLVDMGIEAEEAEDNIATLANPEALAYFRDRQELTG